MPVIPIFGHTPLVDPSAWIAPTASVIGEVTLAASSSVFYSAVVRGDSSHITLGAGSNLQDGVVVHSDQGVEAHIGSGVSVGHGAVVHGCRIGDNTLIGMNATVLNHAVVGTECLIAAGTVVLEGTVVPDGSLVAGVPGKVRRTLSDEERASIRRNAEHYVELSAAHAAVHEQR